MGGSCCLWVNTTRLQQDPTGHSLSRRPRKPLEGFPHQLKEACQNLANWEAFVLLADRELYLCN